MSIIHIIVSFLLFSFLACQKTDFSENKLKIAVIPKGTTHVFWKSIQAGAKKVWKRVQGSD